MAELPEPVVKLLDAAVVASPYGRLLGLELVRAEEDEVHLRLPYRAELTTLGDTVHGGAISGLVDSAATAAFWASADIAPGTRGTTIGFTVDFIAAGRGRDLTAIARVRRRGREICTGEVAVRDSEGTEVALALVTYKLSPPS